MTQHSTNMSAEADLSPAAFEQKYGRLRRNLAIAYRYRGPMRMLDSVVSSVENVIEGAALEATPVDRPIFVLGNFRSGTTFLEQQLARHPSLSYFTYASNAFPRSPRLAKFFCRVMPGFAGTMAMPHQPNMRVDFGAPFEVEPIWRFCRNNIWSDAVSNVLDADFSDPPFERLLMRTIQKQLRFTGRLRFINKNPVNTIRLGFLARVFPTARFVYILRHPLRMLRSQLDAEAAAGRMFPADHERDYGDAFSNVFAPYAKMFARTARHASIAEAFARDRTLGVAMSIADVHETLEATVSRRRLEDRVCVIRYEHLIADFESEFGRLLSFCGLDDEAGARLLPRLASDVDRTLLSQRTPLPRFSPAVLEALAPMLTPLGYEAP